MKIDAIDADRNLIKILLLFSMTVEKVIFF